MDKLSRTQPAFTEPEMEVALQLIQLCGDSDELHPNELSNSPCNMLKTTNRKRKRRKEIVDDDDDDESQGSCTSGVFFITPSFMDMDDDDVAGSRRKKRKFRSVVEIYQISN
ncbi:unnamed protein product [Lactuca saligna]|uniref:Uncharacterized protein n=1 Tax=Lactuca saligna TaxID=75948 RepID=A0AA36EQ36_LACSI|nr:unnamed protein product [Lactuca saligna]